LLIQPNAFKAYTSVLFEGEVTARHGPIIGLLFDHCSKSAELTNSFKVSNSVPFSREEEEEKKNTLLSLSWTYFRFAGQVFGSVFEEHPQCSIETVHRRTRVFQNAH
jgi:hypothetical protein